MRKKLILIGIAVIVILCTILALVMCGNKSEKDKYVGIWQNQEQYDDEKYRKYEITEGNTFTLTIKYKGNTEEIRTEKNYNKEKGMLFSSNNLDFDYLIKYDVKNNVLFVWMIDTTTTKEPNMDKPEYIYVRSEKK